MTPSLLPPNATTLEKAIEQAISLDHLVCAIDSLSDPWSCPESSLPFLAYGASVDFWDENWPVETKRKVVANAWESHAYKGTVHALQVALDAVGHQSHPVEWFDIGGDPGTFRIEAQITDKPLSVDDENEIMAVAQVTKNVRSHLDGLDLVLKSTGDAPVVQCGLSMSQILEIEPLFIPDIDIAGDVPVIALCAHTFSQIEILPKDVA